jgi:glycosyltransferase involved in cell wall biosynthesis
VPAERLLLVPNFVDAPLPGETPGPDNGRWLVAARLSAEKGVLELLRQWPAHEELDVIGDGELLAACRATAPASVRFVGHLDRAELCRRMPSYRGLVFPSRWYEVQPCVHVEALAAGLPVLAFEGSSVAEAVRDHGTGLVTTWDEPLAPVLAEAATRFPRLRAHCRRIYADHFTEQAWLTRISEAYEEATHVARGRVAAPTP